jgi:4-carboxymuconolactone decarboxylase
VRPRIPPITGKDDIAPEHHPLVDRVLEVFDSIRGPFSLLLHSPDLAANLLPMVPYLRHHTVVEDRLRLVGVLAAVREREAEYVWGAQVRLARELGVGEATISVLRTKGDASALAHDEQEVVAFARQLMRANRVEQATFDALNKRHDARWMVEFAAAINFYAMLCGMANAFDLPARPDADRY